MLPFFSLTPIFEQGAVIVVAKGLHNIGQFDVVAHASEIEQFRIALDAVSELPSAIVPHFVPASYAASWLSRADIRDAVHTIPYFSHGPCMLIAQSLSQSHPLQPDQPYHIKIAWRTLDEARHIFDIIASITDLGQRHILSISSTLRVAMPDGASRHAYRN